MQKGDYNMLSKPEEIDMEFNKRKNKIESLLTRIKELSPANQLKLCMEAVKILQSNFNVTFTAKDKSDKDLVMTNIKIQISPHGDLRKWLNCKMDV
jgi:hypothetical protein